MARLSKSKLHSFTIFEDTGITTPDPEIPSRADTEVRPRKPSDIVPIVEEQDGAGLPDSLCLENSDNDVDVDADDERRQSAETSTSISSVAESVIRIGPDNVIPMHQPYTPPFIRPSFRRPASVQRMQMTSPTPSRTISPRQSIVSKSRSRTGTPRSAKSVNVNGSQRSKRWRARESCEEDFEEVKKQDPLVLLHVVVLPVELPWSEEIMQGLLSQHTLDDIRLLRSKLSSNVLQRGVLIPHPGDDYELLEEQLLEALGLQEGRITQCGHFIKPNYSIPPTLSEVEMDSDSGQGSSVESLDGNLCDTCQKPIELGADAGRRKWELKAFAANGLLRSAAWAAAWMEMERVDVEIAPSLSDAVRMQLDDRQKQEDVEQRSRDAEEEARLAVLVEERLARSQEDATWRSGQTAESRYDGTPTASTEPSLVPAPERDLPQIYRPSQVPLSILLKNYVYLLAQDRRNVVMFGIVLLVALLLATRSSPVTQPLSTYSLDNRCAVCPPVSELMISAGNEAVQEAGPEISDDIRDDVLQEMLDDAPAAAAATLSGDSS